MTSVESNEASGANLIDHIEFPTCEVDFYTNIDAGKDNQGDSNSGWFEVKKRNRSSGKCHVRKASTGKRLDGPYTKAKLSMEQNGRDNSKAFLSSWEQKETSSSPNKQGFVKSAAESTKTSSTQHAKDNEGQVKSSCQEWDQSSPCAIECSTTDIIKMESSHASIANEKLQHPDPPKDLVACHKTDALLVPPKFKWGNLDDDDLTQCNLMNSQDKASKSSQINCLDKNANMKIEDSTISLEGGKQSSTKALNGLKNEEPTIASVDSVQTGDASCPNNADVSCSSIPAGDQTDQSVANVLMTTSGLVEDEVSSLKDGIENHAVNSADQREIIVGNTDVIADVVQDISNHVISEKKTVPESLDFSVEGPSKGQQAVPDVCCQDYVVSRSTTNNQSMEFSVAASLLMGKFEETKSGESKERFRQRLWCYLFENLNRAIDELYFLCELECDMEQIQEALLVLKEAGMDFSELKSRVEGFEKIKKHPCPPQGLLREGPAGSYSAKVEHRRPHAIAWEVRRMACSPHRAEILSSSLDAFKKVQQITAQKNLVPQSKRSKASKLLEIDQTTRELSTNQSSPTSSIANRKGAVPGAEDTPKSFTKANIASTSGTVKTNEKQINAEPSVVDSPAGSVSTDDRSIDKITMDLNTELPGNVLAEVPGFASLNNKSNCLVTETVERLNKSTEKRVSIIDNQKEKKTSKTRSSLDAWKVKRNWEDVLSSPLKTLTRPSRSPCAGWRSTERVKVLHDKLMSPERKRKSPMEMKKEVDEKQARATRIRRELENERVQRLQKTTEKLNRVSEWQAVRSNKLREGMHARQQRGESRHEAHLAEIARRAGDESSKVSEVRFITSLNEENKKLSLRQKLQDSELRRAERLQIIKIKQKEDVAREEAVLERRRIIEAERLQRLAEAQRKKEEAKARRDEERKAASAAREARAVEQVRKKEVRAKAQQEVTEQQALKLMEKLRESELRRKCYLEQIRERATMESREQASPSARHLSSKDVQLKMTDRDVSMERESTKQACGSKGDPKFALQHQALKRRVKKIRQRLMAKKYDFVEPPLGIEGFGIGSVAVAAAARAKIGRWLHDLQRFQLARKAGTTGVSFIVAEMIKYFDGKAAELHAARQAGLIDFIATAIPASHTSKTEASQTTLSLLRVLKVLLALPANRSYFISRNLLPPLVPILSTALENFSSQDLVVVTTSSTITGSSGGMIANDEKLDVAGEVLSGLLECVILIINHKGADERQVTMQNDLIELVTACEVIHHLRDLFSLFDRPQVEGAPFPSPVLFGLNLLQDLTSSKGCYKASFYPVNTQISGATEPYDNEKGVSIKIEEHQTDDLAHAVHENQILSSAISVANTAENLAVFPLKETSDSSLADRSQSDSASSKDNDIESEAYFSGNVSRKDTGNAEQRCEKFQEATSVMDAHVSGESRSKNADGKEERCEKPQEPSSACMVEPVVACNEIAQTRQALSAGCHSINFLVTSIAETGLVGLPSLLTAVLLQTNPRSTPEQAAAVLPSNFEEVATCVLKVLNNVARLDLGLVQTLLAMPDLQMEFFHLVSFLLSHCTCKWYNSTDQVALLLLETLLLLGYFSLLHPGNQAVLRWGKSPTILHKICDLPFAFFSDPSLMPVLVGTLLSVCYGSEQNRDVVREELSMEMLLSLLKSSRCDKLAHKDAFVSEATLVPSIECSKVAPQNLPAHATRKEGEALQNIQDDDGITPKEEIKRMIEDTGGSDCETSSSTRQQAALRSSYGKHATLEFLPSPNKRSSKTASKGMVMGEGEGLMSKDMVRGKYPARGNTLASSTENASSQSRKTKINGLDSYARSGSLNAGNGYNKRQPISGAENQPLIDCATTCDGLNEGQVSHRPDLMLQNRFPAHLLDMAQDFFAAGL